MHTIITIIRLAYNIIKSMWIQIDRYVSIKIKMIRKIIKNNIIDKYVSNTSYRHKTLNQSFSIISFRFRYVHFPEFIQL